MSASPVDARHRRDQGAPMSDPHRALGPRLPDPIPLLEGALLLSTQLLIARHPDLLLPPEVRRRHAPPRMRAARALVGLIHALLGALADYRSIHAPSYPPPCPRDEIPF